MLKFGGKFEKESLPDIQWSARRRRRRSSTSYRNECEVEVNRDGFVWTQLRTRRGDDSGAEGNPSKRHRTRPKQPDRAIFPNTKYNFDTLYKHMQELAF
ncbi:MAG: hypothetical protein U0892_08315 [Pirellulales bacterium]